MIYGTRFITPEEIGALACRIRCALHLPQGFIPKHPLKEGNKTRSKEPIFDKVVQKDRKPPEILTLVAFGYFGTPTVGHRDTALARLRMWIRFCDRGDPRIDGSIR
jgi:hypothetical protein